MTATQNHDDQRWRPVLRAEELVADELRSVAVDGIDILLVRSDDAVIACPPLCPHQEEELEDTGMCSGGVLTCTKHLWQWILPGGEPTGDAEQPLLLYPTKTVDGVIYVLVEDELRYPRHP